MPDSDRRCLLDRKWVCLEERSTHCFDVHRLEEERYLTQTTLMAAATAALQRFYMILFRAGTSGLSLRAPGIQRNHFESRQAKVERTGVGINNEPLKT